MTNAALDRRLNLDVQSIAAAAVARVAQTPVRVPTILVRSPNRPLAAGDDMLPPSDTPAPPPAPPSVAAPDLQAQTKAALQALAIYIPTEVITLYLCVIGLVTHPEHVSRPEWRAFLVFQAITPVVVWLVYAGKLRAAGKPIPFAPAQWPCWEIIAASIAFGAWAFGLPVSPFRSFADRYSAAWAGFVPIAASVAIGLLAPLFQKPIQP